MIKWTAFNTKYVLNVLAGKEFRFGINNILSANIKTSWVGGKYITPLNLAASRARGAAVYDENRAYSLRQSAYFRTDIRFSYRREMRRSTMEFSMDLQNITARKNIFQQTYNPRTNELVSQYQQPFFPVPYFRYTF